MKDVQKVSKKNRIMAMKLLWQILKHNWTLRRTFPENKTR